MKDKTVMIRCDLCAKDLVRIIVSKPEAIEFKWKVRAQCPYCHETTKFSNIEGIFSYGVPTKLLHPEDKLDHQDTKSELFVDNVMQSNNNNEITLIMGKRKDAY